MEQKLTEIMELASKTGEKFSKELIEKTMGYNVLMVVENKNKKVVVVKVNNTMYDVPLLDNVEVVNYKFEYKEDKEEAKQLVKEEINNTSVKLTADEFDRVKNGEKIEDIKKEKEVKKEEVKTEEVKTPVVEEVRSEEVKEEKKEVKEEEKKAAPKRDGRRVKRNENLPKIEVTYNYNMEVDEVTKKAIQDRVEITLHDLQTRSQKGFGTCIVNIEDKKVKISGLSTEAEKALKDKILMRFNNYGYEDGYYYKYVRFYKPIA